MKNEDKWIYKWWLERYTKRALRHMGPEDIAQSFRRSTIPGNAYALDELCYHLPEHVKDQADDVIAALEILTAGGILEVECLATGTFYRRRDR